MSKEENLPALLMDPLIEKELNDTENVFITDDFSIKTKPRERGFLVNIDGEWLPLKELPMLILTGVDLYYARYTGEEYIKRPLSDPPPDEEEDNWAIYGKLTIQHPKYGTGGFLLSPSGVLAFKGYRHKWDRNGIDVFGKPLRISSRVTKTKRGFVLNVPVFIAGWLSLETDSPDQAEPNPPEIEHSDYVVEADDDIPF